MGLVPVNVTRLIEEFAKLPGVGRKTASRLTFYLLKRDSKELESFGSALTELKSGIRFCEECFCVSERSPCQICRSKSRDPSQLCIVEEPLDVFAIEKTGQFNGRYHVLGGTISPIDNIGPDDLKIGELVARLSVEENPVEEVFIATNPDLEGDATAMYILRKLKDLDLKKTRLARGLPTGGDLEYADETTLRRAIEGRQEI